MKTLNFLQGAPDLNYWLRPWRRFNDQTIVTTAVIIVLISFLLMITGCKYYKSTTTINTGSGNFLSVIADNIYNEKKYPRESYPEDELEQMIFKERDIYVIDTIGRWHLINPQFSGDTILSEAQFDPVPESSGKELPETRESRRYIPETESDIIKRINFYTDRLYFKDGHLAVIPLSGIKKCEIYKNDARKSASRAIGTVLIVIGSVFALLFLIAVIAFITNPPTSCPFVYVYDGNSWEFAGEIYGGAVYPSLERDDYLAVPGYKCGPGSKYQLKIANELEEIQYINQADLLILAHDSSVYPLVDKYDQVQTISNPVLPYSAIDSKGNDCLAEISVTDRLMHLFAEDPDTSSTSNYLNSLELTFRSNSSPDSAKLFINGKNSLWGDQMIREFFTLFGKRYQKFFRKMEDKPAEFHEEWMRSQGLLLQVFVMKNGKWEPADYFNMVGAFGSRDMVLSLDLDQAWSAENPGNASDYTLRLKLVSGFMFWEIDYAALDMSENAEVGKMWISAENAEDQNGKEVLKLLSDDDERYLVQQKTGDEVTLGFELPGSADPAFTFYLHSKGYYKQAGKSSDEPDISLLETFREPGRLSLWSKRRFEEQRTFYQTQRDNHNNNYQNRHE